MTDDGASFAKTDAKRKWYYLHSTRKNNITLTYNFISNIIFFKSEHNKNVFIYRHTE